MRSRNVVPVFSPNGFTIASRNFSIARTGHGILQNMRPNSSSTTIGHPASIVFVKLSA